MASCDLEVMNHHGARPLCRFVYTEHGFAMPTMHDGGSHVHYRHVGGVTNSLACIAAQGHGTPDRMPQVCHTGESPCIASRVDPTGVLTPQSTATPALVNDACLTPAASDGGVASSLEESPIPLAEKPMEPVAVDYSRGRTGTVATVKACSQSSADFVTTLVEYPRSLEQSPVSKK